MQKVSIIVPIYKKENIIKICVSKKLNILDKICSKMGLDYELIAVIDGHLDNAKEKLEEIKHNKLQIYEYFYNRGKGFAVHFGMMKASGDYIGFIDSGLDLDPKCLWDLIGEIIKSNTHIVVGSKKHKESKLVYPFKRRLFTKGYSIFGFCITGIKYDDTQVGAKIFSRELVDKLLPRVLVKRFAFDIELLEVAARLGYIKHTDIPVKIDFMQGQSDAVSIPSIFYMLKDTLAVGYRLKIIRYYDDKNQKKWVESLYDLLKIEK